MIHGIYESAHLNSRVCTDVVAPPNQLLDPNNEINAEVLFSDGRSREQQLVLMRLMEGAKRQREAEKVERLRKLEEQERALRAQEEKKNEIGELEFLKQKLHRVTDELEGHVARSKLEDHSQSLDESVKRYQLLGLSAAAIQVKMHNAVHDNSTAHSAPQENQMCVCDRSDMCLASITKHSTAMIERESSSLLGGPQEHQLGTGLLLFDCTPHRTSSFDRFVTPVPKEGERFLRETPPKQQQKHEAFPRETRQGTAARRLIVALPR